MGGLLSRVVLCIGLASMLGAVACAAPSDDTETGSSEAAATGVTGAPPADPSATAATRTVLANLQGFDFGSANPFDHRILVGQQEADVSNRTSSGLAVVDSDFQKVAGKAPALVSYELSHVYRGSSSAFDAAAFRAGAPALRTRILEHHARGSLVSLVWHLRCPKARATDADKFAPGDCPRDYRLDELLEHKSDGTRGAHFTEWRAMLDAVAELLWSLKDEQGQLVPVQLRPFHEFTGEWFWWGRDNGGNAYAAVWREMVSYLRDGRGLHNALWVFCPAAPSDGGHFESFYPGDAYVDVVAFDRYDFGNGAFARGYEADLRTIGAFARTHRKVAAVAEVGTDLGRRGNADPTWFSRAMLAPLQTAGRSFAYVSLWRNAPWEKFVPEPGDGAIADDFKQMATDPAALMSGEHDLYSPLHVGPSS
jgi:hypothetical protein